MNNGDARNYEMMVRVEHFGERHLSDFSATSLGRKAFADLAAVIRELEQPVHGSDHELGKRTWWHCHEGNRADCTEGKPSTLSTPRQYSRLRTFMGGTRNGNIVRSISIA